jgi:hypothetical protein
MAAVRSTVAGPSADALKQPVYAFEFLTFRAGDQTQLEVFCEIPEHRFQFVKYAKGFYASYELSVSIRDEENGLVYGKTIVDSARVSKYSEIEAFRSPHVIRFTHRGEPGEYTAQISLRDVETSKVIEFAKAIQLPDYRDSMLSLSDLQVGSRISMTKHNGKLEKHLEANVRRAFIAGSEPLYVYAEVYNMSYTPDADQGEFLVTYTIEDGNGVYVERKQSRFRKPGDSSFMTLKVLTEDLPRGLYKLHVDVLDLETHQTTKKSTSFSIKNGVHETI